MLPDPSAIKSNIIEALNDQRLRAAVMKATDHSLTKRAEVVAELPHWEALRSQAAQRRQETLLHIDEHLLQLERKASEKGIKVHWASDGAIANRLIGELCQAAVASGMASPGQSQPLIVKSKSMTTEEIGLAPALQAQGFEVVETDLGEYIVQIAGQMPSHITAPALHLSRSDVGRLFADKLGVPYQEDPVELIGIARKILRRKFLSADIGITGCNFAVAESGTPLIVENEGNGRLVSAIPKVQIIVMGMEKVVPTWEDLMILLELLPRSATGQRMTGSVLYFNRPSTGGEPDGPRELHLVILDNGRSRALADPQLRSILCCIRCGACLNVCPVYRRVGGHAYGWVYPGPIGSVLAPIFLGLEKTKDQPFASTLCGRCDEICPVKIDLHHKLLELRHRIIEAQSNWTAERGLLTAWKFVLDRPELYHQLAKLPRFLLHDICRTLKTPGIPVWKQHRDSPDLARRSFSQLFQKEFGSD
ncbi:MAG: LutB/LldF family L-lactate oxidation iron-sulfur protein [bacterium]|nr:LutB/LldF family L-lactate oxidation iron-sulfur protein [bacterium]